MGEIEEVVKVLEGKVLEGKKLILFWNNPIFLSLVLPLENKYI